jgi:hypothetical protein
MKDYFRRYFILAVRVAVIIGLAFYILLNNFLDKEEILVAANDLEIGATISIEDLNFIEFYKNSLPQGYLLAKEGLIGKTINIKRKKGDYLSLDMFEEDIKVNDIFDYLDGGDAMIAIEITHPEPLLDMLKEGDMVTIVSAKRDKDFLLEYTNNGTKGTEYNDSEFNVNSSESTYLSSDYIEMNTFRLSKNILSIDGQIVIRNLKIVNFQRDVIENSSSLLINNEVDFVKMYFKCELEEAPIIARITSDNKYKIIFEKL